MAIAFLSISNTTFLSLSSSSLTSSSSSSSSSSKHNNNVSLSLICCKGENKESTLALENVSKRRFCVMSSISSAAIFMLPLVGKGGPHSGGGGGGGAEAAVLEAEDDLELLEKVKKDRKKRLEKQGIINSSKTETGYLQEVVYKLSEVGQAIENNDLNTASSVLGKSTDTDWIKKANSAFSKLSSSPEENTEVQAFNISISELISSVVNKDVDSSKIAFVSSASAFEKWTALTGLVDQLKGL